MGLLYIDLTWVRKPSFYSNNAVAFINDFTFDEFEMRKTKQIATVIRMILSRPKSNDVGA